MPFFKNWLLKQNMYSKCACFLHCVFMKFISECRIHLIHGYTYSPQHFFVLCLYLNLYDFHESGRAIWTKYTSVDKFYEHFFCQMPLFQSDRHTCPVYHIYPNTRKIFVIIRLKNVRLTLKLLTQWNVFHVVVFLKIEDCEGKRFTCGIVLPLGKYSRRHFVCLQNKYLKQSL